MGEKHRGHVRDVRRRGSIAAAIVLASCGTFLPEEDGPASTTGADAATEETGSPSTDGAGLPDGSVAGDAGCTRPIDEHFTGGSAPQWESAADGGAVGAVPDGGRTDPGALRAVVSAGASDTNAQLVRRLTPPAMPTSATLAFAMRVAAASTNYFELGCTLQLASNDLGSFLSLNTEVLGGADLAFDTSAKLNAMNVPTGEAVAIGALALDEWYAVEIALTAMTPNGALVTVRVNGAEVDRTTRPFPAPPQTIRVKCGVDYGQAGGAAEVYVDDVVLELCP